MNFLQKVMLSLFLVILGAGAAQAQTRAYVTNNSGDSVSVIDTSTKTVIATVPVNTGALDVVVTPNGAFAYVGNNNVSVIDTVTNTVTATVPAGNSGFLAITPNGSFVYGTLDTFAVDVISTATNTLVAKLHVEGAHSVDGIAITPNGAFAYVAGADTHAVYVIDTTSNTTVGTIPIEGDPRAIAFTPNGAFAYVAHSQSVSVIDTATRTVVATIPLEGDKFGIAIAPNGAFAYVANFSSDTISVIDTATNTVTATIPMGTGTRPWAVKFTQNGAFAYVTLSESDSVAAIDTATKTVIATIPVGDRPTGIAFGTPPAGPFTPISTCGTIANPGRYKLVNDLTSVGTCLTIKASHVDLDLNGHTLTGPTNAVDGFSGIMAVAVTDLEIKGPGVITNFGSGVRFGGVDFSEVKDVTSIANFHGFNIDRDFFTPNLSNLSENNVFKGNTSTGHRQQGFSMNGASNNILVNNVVSNNGANGIGIAVGSGNQIKANTTGGNFIGIAIGGAGGNMLKDNNASGNRSVGIFLAGGATGNTVKGNTAQGNPSFDFRDDNANCDNNDWKGNLFTTKNQPCIQ